MTLLLNDNAIARVAAIGLFNRLPQLQKVDLSRNQIKDIEEGAFEGAGSIKKMLVLTYCFGYLVTILHYLLKKYVYTVKYRFYASRIYV